MSRGRNLMYGDVTTPPAGALMRRPAERSARPPLDQRIDPRIKLSDQARAVLAGGSNV